MNKRIIGIVALSVALSISAFGKSLRVGTYNVRNYLSTGRVVEGQYRQDYPKPEVEKKALREVIKNVNADVLAIQEMGNDLYLDELLEDLKSEGLEYPYYHLMYADDKERHTAVISKEPFDYVHTHRDLKYKYFDKPKMPKRGLLEIGFKDGDEHWTLFVVHLKSKSTISKKDPEAKKQRLGEAVAIRNKIASRFKHPEKSKFLVVGDFNDAPNSKTLRRFYKIGKKQLTKRVGAVDKNGEFWTYFRRSWEQYAGVDFVLASPAMYTEVKDRYGTIYGGPETIKASDHRLVYVDIDV